MSSGSRVRREGTIAMSSNPYARRAFLPRPISISIAASLQLAPDRRRGEIAHKRLGDAILAVSMRSPGASLRRRRRPGRWAGRMARIRPQMSDRPQATDGPSGQAGPAGLPYDPRAIEHARQRGVGGERRLPHAPAERAEQSGVVHQGLGAVHLRQRAHRPRAQLRDRRRLRALPARARGAGAVRVRLRRLRAARRARGDRQRGVPRRVGGALRRAHDRPAASGSASPSTGSARS